MIPGEQELGANEHCGSKISNLVSCYGGIQTFFLWSQACYTPAQIYLFNFPKPPFSSICTAQKGRII